MMKLPKVNLIPHQRTPTKRKTPSAPKKSPSHGGIVKIRKVTLADISRCEYDEVIQMDELPILETDFSGLGSFNPLELRISSSIVLPTFQIQLAYYLSRATDAERIAYHLHVHVSDEEALLISTYTQGSPEWLASRLWRIGASELASFLSKSSWSTMRSALVKKASGEPFEGNTNTRFGSDNEDQGRQLVISDLQQRAYAQIQKLLDPYLALLKKQHDGDATQKKSKFRFYQLEYDIPDDIIRQYKNGELTPEKCVWEILPRRGFLIHPVIKSGGGSGDGELMLLGIYRIPMLEIKWPGNKEPYKLSKREHYIQIQWTLFIYNCPLMLYCVFSPKSYTLSPFYSNKRFQENYLVPHHLRIYFKLLLPALVAHQEVTKKLKEGIDAVVQPTPMSRLFFFAKDKPNSGYARRSGPPLPDELGVAQDMIERISWWPGDDVNIHDDFTHV